MKKLLASLLLYSLSILPMHLKEGRISPRSSDEIKYFLQKKRKIADFFKVDLNNPYLARYMHHYMLNKYQQQEREMREQSSSSCLSEKEMRLLLFRFFQFERIALSLPKR